ncbi:hypothetical protein VKT23_009877 [Stygiomarasmius scandens]|uniref:DUF659 domain-containing protein n=1 Tax=Marasmiellus scandens TaxID=2682957 RepID=A0ABR1JHQ3_9AGAR
MPMPNPNQGTPPLVPTPIFSSSTSSSTVFYGETASQPMPSVLLREFHSDICMLFVSGHVAWHAVDNPYWHYFFSKWVPGSVLPGCNILSGRILNEEVGKADAETRVEVNGWFSTGQSDGWKNIAKNSLITSMVNMEYKTHLLNIANISFLPKTVETLLEIILKEITHVWTILMVHLVAWRTDCSGKSLKMQCLLWEHFDWIVVLDCWAHQFNLVVSDILKLKLPMVKVADQALEVIKWFLLHSIALGLLNKEQLHAEFTMILILILPILTHWTSHFLSMDRLLQLEVPLHRLILSNPLKAALIKAAGAKAAAKSKAQHIIWLIRKDEFW